MGSSSLALAAGCLILSYTEAMSAAVSRTVLVSGAGGQTGKHVFKKMLSRPDLGLRPVGIVRTEESRAALLEECRGAGVDGDGESTVSPDSVIVCDVSDRVQCETLLPPFDAIVIGSSAKPSPTGETNPDTGGPIFGFPNGQPEVVDWIGQKNQIDAALRRGMETHVVICSSMGGTDPDHMLNRLGRTTTTTKTDKEEEDGTTSSTDTTTGGNILRWKRKAEMYLSDSGLPYTIVHPGGLLNEAGGKRELVVGVDDVTEGTGSDNRSIPREDVAEVLVQSLLLPSYKNRSFDVRSKPEGEGDVTADFDALLARLNGKNSDYSLGVAGA